MTWLSTIIACNLTSFYTKSSSTSSSSEVPTTPSLRVWLLQGVFSSIDIAADSDSATHMVVVVLTEVDIGSDTD